MSSGGTAWRQSETPKDLSTKRGKEREDAYMIPMYICCCMIDICANTYVHELVCA